MTDFSVTATLYAQLDESSLRESRKTLEDELTADPIEVDVTPVERPGSTMDGLGGGPPRADGGRGRRTGGLAETMGDQTSLLSGLGDSWEHNLELNEERNEYLEDLIEEIEKMAYDQATSGGGGGGLLQMLGIRAVLGGVSATSVGGAAAGLGVVGSAFGANAKFGGRSNAEVVGRSLVQSGGNPAAATVQAGAQITRSIGMGDAAQGLADDIANRIQSIDLPDLNIPDNLPVEVPDIPDLEVPDLPDWSWPSLPEFSWPGLPDWSWPSLPEFSWPSLPDWSWPGLPDFSWPSLPDFDFSWPELPEFSWPELPPPLGGSSSGDGQTTRGGTGSLISDWTPGKAGNSGGFLGNLGGSGSGPVQEFLSQVGQFAANPTNRGGGTTSSTGRDPRERYYERRERDENRGSSSTKTKAPQVDFNPTYELDTSSLERQVQSDIRDVKKRLSDLEGSFGGGTGRY